MRGAAPLVISASVSLDLEDLHGVGRPDWFLRGPAKYHHLPPNSIGKTQVIAQRAADRKKKSAFFSVLRAPWGVL